MDAPTKIAERASANAEPGVVAASVPDVGVLASGVPMTVHFVLTERPVVAAFLGYLLVITGNAMWMVWRAVTDKRDWRAMVARPAWRTWMVATLACGIGVLALVATAALPTARRVTRLHPTAVLRTD